MSIAYFQHPNGNGLSYLNGYQYQSQQQLYMGGPPPPPPHIIAPLPPTNYHHNNINNSLLWHARSMESGLGN